MNYFPFILLAVFVPIAIQYVLEVHVGSSISMYDAELGLLSENSPPRKSTRSQFLGRLVPLQLAAIGLPLLAYNYLSGILLVLIALFLFLNFNRFFSGDWLHVTGEIEDGTARLERCTERTRPPGRNVPQPTKGVHP
jgi:hypothetical protein